MFMKPDISSRRRGLLLAGCIVGLLTVLMSQTRGAYGVLIILPLMLWFLWRKKDQNKPKIRMNWILFSKYATYAVISIACLWSIKNTKLIERPISAINNAVQQFKGSQASLSKNYNTSIGARLYLWSKSSDAILMSPWIGYGHDGRMSLLIKWQNETELSEPKKLGHVHNEYLHSLLDHGVLGLASFITYLFGLAIMAFKLNKHQYHSQATALFGMLLMHTSTALSNVNFAHNYYPTMLSLMVSIVLWSVSASQTKKVP
jgi:O-antigen ligase